ncbi:uncharacterized protein LOC141677554 [Apium graveolens]|uniref:uncharacterized protein LOC141677554 n=1 Tax=Apium graveolens TaxID=4045 RepID=UPI003D7C1247
MNSSKDYSWIFRSNPMIHWSFKVLICTVLLGILIVWGIDGWDVSSFHTNFVDVRLSSNSTNQDFLLIHDNASTNHVALSYNSTFVENLTQKIESLDPNGGDVNQTDRNIDSVSRLPDVAQVSETKADIPGVSRSPDAAQVNQTKENVTSVSRSPGITQVIPPNVTQHKFDVSDDGSLQGVPDSGYLEWLSAELEPNYTTNLLANWLAPGGEACRDSETVNIVIPGLDGNDQIELSTGKIHEFVFQAVDEEGKPRCLGGDYFETDISGELWKSRPPVQDLGNGTYKFSLQVHSDFSGKYEFTVILLFRHYQGLKFSPERFSYDKVLRKVPINIVKSSGKLPEIKQCQKSDLSRNLWSGRWTRHAKNDNCNISNDGRYRCQKPNFPCKEPWCYGSLGSLESNGWTYSTHCSFKLYSSEAAWNCLNKRWIFFWGDSNHCDTIRNILKFILNVDFEVVPRRFDMNITNPNNPMQTVRITSIFNGNHNASGNYQGLNSLYNIPYRELLKQYFSQETVPDTVIMNSGLHDGVFWPNIRRFNKGAEDAAAFWAELLEGVKQRKLMTPEVIFRSTIATGGYARRLAFNPSKMEAFNGVLLEKLRQHNIVTSVIDDFDLTYPWHFDNRCNDGVHYGRAPAKLRWRDGQIGHQYFVDLMLCHVLLNALCEN